MSFLFHVFCSHVPPSPVGVSATQAYANASTSSSYTAGPADDATFHRAATTNAGPNAFSV